MIKIALGNKVRDKVTGYEGIVTTHSKYLNGCDRFGVTSQKLHEGKPISAQWFDLGDLEVVVEKTTEVTPPGEGVG